VEPLADAASFYIDTVLAVGGFDPRDGSAITSEVFSGLRSDSALGYLGVT
jgi:hypothetical protein